METRNAFMEARMEERATMAARATRVARAIARATGNRVEPSATEPAAHIQELVEDGDLDSATEEETGALGCGTPTSYSEADTCGLSFLSMNLDN